MSTVTAGPSKPKVYETRPDSTLRMMPVIRCASTSCGGAAASSRP